MVRTVEDIKQEINLMSQVLTGKQRKDSINSLKAELNTLIAKQTKLAEESSKLIQNNPKLLEDPKFVFKRILLGETSQVIKDAYTVMKNFLSPEQEQEVLTSLIQDQLDNSKKASTWLQVRKLCEYRG